MTKYAKALHQLAVEQKKVDKINLYFDEIRSLVSKNPKWIEMMDSPMLNLDDKMDMINALDFDPLFLIESSFLISGILISGIITSALHSHDMPCNVTDMS